MLRQMGIEATTVSRLLIGPPFSVSFIIVGPPLSAVADGPGANRRSDCLLQRGNRLLIQIRYLLLLDRGCSGQHGTPGSFFECAVIVDGEETVLVRLLSQL